ncbi:MAG: hypothetical protein HY331_12135 [Chloroflexi bacterium]|nr:hypothetical protein [Chloroflexota bacterium]
MGMGPTSIDDDSQTSGASWPTPDPNDDPNVGIPGWPWQLAGVMWDLKHDDVVEAIRWLGSGWTRGEGRVRSFYEILPLDLETTFEIGMERRKQIFRNHNFDTFGWPPTQTLATAMSAAAVGPAAFTDVYTHTVSDADGNGRWDSLTVGVGISTTQAGEYRVLAFLEGDSGHSCAASGSAVFGAGVFTVPLTFDGDCLFQNRVAGSYRLADVYLEDGANAVLDYRATAYVLPRTYAPADFEPTSVYPVGYATRVEDADGNSLYDRLLLDVGLFAARPITVGLAGDLFDSTDGGAASGRTEVVLPAGTTTVTLPFDGRDLYAAGATGPYTLRGLAIRDLVGCSNGGCLLALESTIYSSDPDLVLYMTPVFTFTQFERPPASLGAVLAQAAADTDGDGLFDRLSVTATVAISPGAGISYTVLGTLSQAGKDVARAERFVAGTGLLAAALDFDGREIRRSHAGGPYTVTLLLRDDARNCGETLGCFSSAVVTTTAPYSSTQFQLPPEEYLSIAYRDRGTDLDGNGLYDFLTVDLDAAAVRSGTYHLTGRLQDAAGRPVATAPVSATLDGVTRTVSSSFPGADLWRGGLAGSRYTLTLALDDAATGQRLATLADVYTTAAYTSTQFEPPAARFIDRYADRGIDVDGDGLYDDLDVDVGVQVVVAGTYRLQAALLAGGGLPIAEAAAAGPLTTGTVTVTLRYDGIAIREAGAAGPYTLTGLVLEDADARRLDERTAPYTNTAYTLSQFEQGGIISGTVGPGQPAS